MSFFAQPSDILVTCPKAMPPYLCAELAALGYPAEELPAGVLTRGTPTDCMRLNLHLRTGHRVLYQLHAFAAPDPDALYGELVALPWEDWIPVDGHVHIASAVRNEHIRDTRFANLRCKDAIVDRINRVKGRRPDSGPDLRGAAVFLHWQESDARIYLNTSGEPLQRRGYRLIPHRAPLQETLAAAIILAMQWPEAGHFVNPMCGSGTLAIEAALMRLHRAPGLIRDAYAFRHLLGFPARAWEDMRHEAQAQAREWLEGEIIATDHDPKAVDAARRNARAAGVERAIRFQVCDFRETHVPEGTGVVVFNPEYGERLGFQRELEAVYAGIGDFFKARCQDYTGYVFTGNPGLAKKVGLRARRRTPFFNSKIECRLLEYELYAGSRREPKADGA
ncbi:MAG: class I SAM-dependent RNA methyltransferase [Desulfovibrionaceae bacterium]